MSKGSYFLPAVIVLGVVGAAYYFTVNSLKSLTLAFKSVGSNIKFSFPYLYIPLNIEIENPNRRDVVFNELRADVLMNGTKAAALIYTTPVTIKALTTTVIKNLIIKSEIFSTIDKATDGIAAKTITFRIVGDITIDNKRFPLDTTLKVS